MRRAARADRTLYLSTNRRLNQEKSGPYPGDGADRFAPPLGRK
ncbi:hypothetical protein ACFSR7_24320 [Cohnella sp. GCM10020058]